MTRIKQLLLVEDNAEDQQIVAALLDEVPDQPFALSTATTIEDALARLANEHIDIMLVDLHLPDSSGWSTFESLRPHGTPIIILSGLVDEALAARAIREGAQNYLIKWEVGGHLLTRLLLHAIERHSIQNALRTRTAQLSESEHRFRTVVEELADGVILFDWDGEPIFTNRAARRLTEEDGPLLAKIFKAGEGERLSLRESATVQVRSSALRWKGRLVRASILKEVTSHQHFQDLSEEVRQDHERVRRMEEVNTLRTAVISQALAGMDTQIESLQAEFGRLIDGIRGSLSQDQNAAVDAIQRDFDQLTAFVSRATTAVDL